LSRRHQMRASHLETMCSTPCNLLRAWHRFASQT